MYWSTEIVAFCFVQTETPSSSIGWGNFSQILSAIVSAFNLSLVLYFYFQNRKEKQKESAKGLLLTWYQKCITEPSLGNFNETTGKLTQTIEQALLEVKSSTVKGSSASDSMERISQAVKILRYKTVPILRVMIPDHSEVDKIDWIIDDLDDKTNENIALIYRSEISTSEKPFHDIDTIRADFFGSLLVINRLLLLDQTEIQPKKIRPGSFVV